MSIKFISPKKSVNSAFLKIPVSVENIEQFRLSLRTSTKSVMQHEVRNTTKARYGVLSREYICLTTLWCD